MSRRLLLLLLLLPVAVYLALPVLGVVAPRASASLAFTGERGRLVSVDLEPRSVRRTPLNATAIRM